MKHRIFLMVVATLFFLASCKKEKNQNTTDIPGLPPVTETGANTLGFLLNGVPWVPAGNNGTANLSIDFDPGFNNGIVNIAAYSAKNLQISQLVLFIKDSLNSLSVFPFSYKIGKAFLGGVIFTDTNSCERHSEDSTNYCSGVIRISKLDWTNNIITGVFECKLFNPNCGDTIKITNGRFDMKF
jgi:hypothetical protein